MEWICIRVKKEGIGPVYIRVISMHESGLNESQKSRHGSGLHLKQKAICWLSLCPCLQVSIPKNGPFWLGPYPAGDVQSVYSIGNIYVQILYILDEKRFT